MNIRSIKMLATTALLLGIQANAHAQLNGSGYYRMLNTETQRYLTVTNDNLGSSMSAAFTALVTVKGFDNVVSDPSSILYLRSVGGEQYDLVAQSVDTYKLTGYHFNIGSSGSAYNAYASYLFITYKIGDNVKEGSTKSQADLDGTAKDWYILPVNTNEDQCFGFTPDCQDVSGLYYTTCYASFPFKPSDAGVKAFYIDEIKDNYALMREITGEVPAATPVIIQCSSSRATKNRAMPLTTSPTAITGNLLKGVYFNKTNQANPNYVQYDENTMLVLGITSSGQVGLVKSNIYRLPANKAYFPMNDGQYGELKLITHEEYDKQNPPTPPEEEPVTVTADNIFRIYGDENPNLTWTEEGGTLKGTPELVCEATATSPVGTYPITVKKGSVENTKATYVDGTLTIMPAPLTASVDYVYRLTGQENPELEIHYDGFKNDEGPEVLTSLPQVECEATADSPAGNYDINVIGGEAENYSIYCRSSILFVFNSKMTANSYTREYGEENPTFEYSPEQPFGLPSISCEATQSSPAGDYNIEIGQGNLIVDGIEFVNGTLTVTPATLTVTVADVEIEQGEELPAFQISYEGWKLGDDENSLKIRPVASVEATSDSPAGDYVITISGGESQNYTFNYVSGKLTIKEPSAIVSIEADENIYDVYSVSGQIVAQGVTSLDALPKGIYVIKKVSKGKELKTFLYLCKQ